MIGSMEKNARLSKNINSTASAPPATPSLEEGERILLMATMFHHRHRLTTTIHCPSDMEKSPFDLEHQYRLFLEHMYPDFNVRARMHPEQRKQLKNAFFAGVGQMLNVMVIDVAALEEEEAMEAMGSMTGQVNDYWLKQTGWAN